MLNYYLFYCYLLDDDDIDIDDANENDDLFHLHFYYHQVMNNDDDVYRKYGFIFTMFFLLIGIIGHFLTIFVFSQKRFR